MNQNGIRDIGTVWQLTGDVAALEGESGAQLAAIAVAGCSVSTNENCRDDLCNGVPFASMPIRGAP